MSTEAAYEKDDFLIYVPDVCGVLEKASEEARYIGGLCSTESLDRQGEIVFQRGLDFSEFTNHGFYNDNHKQETAAVVGIPELAEYRYTKGWYTEGTLLKGVPRSDEIWKLAKALSSTKRRLGFSIEGKVLERRGGNRIVKARVRNVAVTNAPVNTDCSWEIITKSFCEEFDQAECSGSCCIIDKARHVAKSGDDHVLVNGATDLFKGEIRYLFNCPEVKCEASFSSGTALDVHLEKSHSQARKGLENTVIRRSTAALTPAQAIETLRRLRPQWAEATCKRVVDWAMRQGA